MPMVCSGYEMESSQNRYSIQIKTQLIEIAKCHIFTLDLFSGAHEEYDVFKLT